MADERNYYVICDSGCRFPAMTKEQVLAAIAEATGKTAVDADAAFITKLKEGNANEAITFWIGTTAEYNAIVARNAVVTNCLYILTDETFGKDVDRSINALTKTVNNLENRINPLTIDTGWLKLYADNAYPNQPRQDIGKYRLIGNIAYFVLDYPVSSCIKTYETNKHEFALPVIADRPDVFGANNRSITMAYALAYNYSKAEGELYTTMSVFGGIKDDDNGIFVVENMYKYPSASVSAYSPTLYGAFSFPYKALNPNYVGE